MVPQVDWLYKWARYQPSRLALRDHGRQLDWSYGQADARAQALAAYLRDERGVQRGDRVAVLANNMAETVFLFFACVKLGAILVPLNFRLTRGELSGLLGDCEPRILFHDEAHAELADELKPNLPATSLVGLAEVGTFLTGELHVSTLVVDRPGNLDDAVMILYTAGTTGVPKGAIINHRMILWNAINTSLRLDLTSSDHTQGYAPFFHTGGWHVLMTPFLHHGASTTLLERFDADLILDLMEKERTTVFFGVPTMMRMLSESPRFAHVDLSACRYAIVGGAPMPIPLINTWHDKGIPIRQGYGMTEVGPNCFSLHQDHAIRKRGSIGQPNFYIDARIVAENGADCSDGEAGELWLRSEVVTPGYWRKPEETAAAITDGWFHTGDMVTRDPEGYYHVVDRKKNMFISGGENVYPAEVEQVIVMNPAIKEAAVIGVADAQWGEVGRAFVVLQPGASLEHDDLRHWCLDKLAKYKIPKHVQILPSLPVNQAGKIDRLRLKELD